MLGNGSLFGPVLAEQPSPRLGKTRPSLLHCWMLSLPLYDSPFQFTLAIMMLLVLL